MTVIQLAGELQAPINEHADALAEEFFWANCRPELPSVLRSVRDLVKAVLHQASKSPTGVTRRGGGSRSSAAPASMLRQRPRPRLQPAQLAQLCNLQPTGFCEFRCKAIC